ncbi:hypothetical protein RF11_09683 [Thelohanellus kitauei]|uniref:DUF4604 domain-containing protein n=1 Tax=Thelohanellus kitauei TaxID=669202 RepID=A0A0C2N203_THEKT|nr:hypothetical protein RF11_09683 [Thelohanellus kitauei]
MGDRRRKVEAITPAEPKFLREYKEKKGYREPSKVEDKYISEIDETKQVPIKEDELPVILIEGQEMSTEDKLALFQESEKPQKHSFKKPESQGVSKKSTKSSKIQKSSKMNANKLSFQFED